MTTICLIIPSLLLGGAERSAVKLINAAVAHGHEAQIVCLNHADPAVLAEISPRVIVTVLNRKSSADPVLLWRVTRELRGSKPSLLIGWSTYANFVSLLCGRIAGISRICISERIYIPTMLSDPETSRSRRAVILALIRWLYPKATILTANSARGVRFLGRYLRMRNRSVLLPNLFNAELFDSLAERLVNTPDLPTSHPRLLAVGRLEYQKGFDILIDAFAKVVEHEDWHLVIAGSGSQDEKLRNQASRLKVNGKIVFLPKTPNPFPLYRWADIVIVPSRFEGFPNVPMEAMGMGTAVIVADCKSGPRELSDGGRYAILVPVDDPEKLSAAIIRLGRNLDEAKLLGLAARNHVRQVYGEQRVWRAYEDALSLAKKP